MKRIICIVFFSLLVLSFIQAKQLPDFVKQRLDSVHKAAKRSLMYYRFWDVNDGDMTLPCHLGYDVFGDDETELIEGLRLNLSVGMIYDNEMRDRLVQLLRNEYQNWELDSLTSRYIKSGILGNEREAIQVCKFDTMQNFKHTVDSFYIDLKNKNPEDLSIIKYDYAVKGNFEYDVFKFLQLDTTTIFKQVYNKIVKREIERYREELFSNMYSYFSNIHQLVELCGYIGDKRFIKPLIEVLDKLYKSFLEEYSSSEDFYNLQREKVLEALARMRVEPYYSDFVKKRTLRQEQIKDKEWLNFSLNDFVYVLGTQEAFLELSKYLLSNKPYTIIMEDSDVHAYRQIYPVSNTAYYLIRDNIENEDIQKIISPYRENIDALFKPLYDWMQKNYGNYKIRRIW